MAKVSERVDRHMEKRVCEATAIENRLSGASAELGDAEGKTAQDSGHMRRAEGRVRERDSGAITALEDAVRAGDAEVRFLAESAAEAERIRSELERVVRDAAAALRSSGAKRSRAGARYDLPSQKHYRNGETASDSPVSSSREAERTRQYHRQQQENAEQALMKKRLKGLYEGKNPLYDGDA